jgi:hypothetical protein
MTTCVTIDLGWFKAALFYGWEKDEIPWELWQDFGSNYGQFGVTWSRSARDGVFHMQSVSDPSHTLVAVLFQGHS